MTTQTLIRTMTTLEDSLKKIKKGYFGLTSQKKPLSLKGSLKGIKITWKDIEAAKKSVIKK